MAATRRQGRWCGGKPLLGYDLDAQAAKLVVNEPEAARVRAIFDLYREHRSLRPVVRELAQRGWRTKRWRTRAGQERGGELITKTHLRRLLTNVTYLGQVRYRTEVYPGQHAALVDPEVWQQVQTLLQDRRRWSASGDRPVEALLHGLLCCGPCACPMTPTSTTRHRAKRYRYYVCVQAQKGGWDACPAPSVPAGVIEHCVIEQVDGLSRNLSGLGQLLTQAREQTAARQAELEADERRLEQEQADGQAALQVLAGQLGAAGDARTVCSRLADLQERLTGLERQTAAVRAQRQAFGLPEVATEAVAHALAEVAAEWPALPAAEQARRLRQLVERVDYDGTHGQATITFHAAGLVTLAQEGADHTQEKQP